MGKAGKKRPSWADSIANGLTRGLLWLLLRLPYRLRIPAAGWTIAHLVAPLAGYRTRIRENLALVRPDLPRAEVERLTRAVADNVGRTMVEMYSGDAFKAHVADTPLTGPGVAALLAAQAAGRPIILATGHFGNYNVARVVFTARGGRVGGLYKPMANPGFDAHYVAAMKSMSEPIFPRGNRGLAEMVRFLRSGGMLGLLTDQHMRHGVALPFFGQPARTATSAADLANKYDALLVPVYGVRRDNGLDFDIVVEAPVPHGDPVEMTRQINASLEAMVRRHMDQWFWIHRRWK